MSRSNDDMIYLDGQDELVNPLSIFSPCIDCRNYLVAYTCKAFPEGIPQQFLDGGHDHKTPFPGDHGIMFEGMTETEQTERSTRRAPDL
jgi:hypothetical protein